MAGNGRPGDPGSGGSALQVSLLDVVAMVMATDGSIYLADSGTDRVMRLATDGLLEIVAGNGQSGPAVEGAAPTGTSLSDPAGLALTADGSLLIAENGTGRILTVRPGADAIGVLAADLPDPGMLAVAQNGSVYVAGEAAGRLDRVDSQGAQVLVDSSGNEEALLDPVLAAPRSLALTGGGLVALGASGSAFLIG